MPSDCTKYSLNRLQSESNRLEKTNENESAPRDNMRIRYFSIYGHSIPLPENRFQYSAIEVCNILLDVQYEIDIIQKRTRKDISINKVIDAMIVYHPTPLIPATRSVMYRVYNKFKHSGEASWSSMGRIPILNNSSFLSAVDSFEKDKGCAISKKDLTKLLKDAKSEVAVEKGNSTTVVITPTKRSSNNYFTLLPQLNPARSITNKVQQKSEARYIAERSVRNAISHIMAVCVVHYLIGKQDKRMKRLRMLQRVLDYCTHWLKRKTKI